MPVLVALAVVVLLAGVILIVSRPLRNAGGEREADDHGRAALEIAKEAKYREIRDAEMDFRTGKLSEADYRSADRQLRAEAVELLRAIDEL